MPKDPITLLGVGDVIVNRNPESVFAHVRPTLQTGDIVFCNSEASYSDKGAAIPKVGGSMSVASPAKNLAGLKNGGFSVVTMANNHFLDFGYEAFLDALERLDEFGIGVFGAGKDIAAARKPLVQGSAPNRVAFLGYAPVTYQGYEATEKKPGCAPMRIVTAYRASESEQPGNAPDILTFADPADLAAMQADIRRARTLADVVVVSFHWGILFTPAVIAMYENQVGYAAIDAGADLILGHHQHILKGIQVYKGKAIFHGLGNFALGGSRAAPTTARLQDKDMTKFFNRYGEYGPGVHGDYVGFHPDAYQTVIAKVVIGGGRIQQVGFIPCMMDIAGGHPVVCNPADTTFQKVANYMAQISKDAGFDTQFQVRGEDVLVKT